MQQKLGVIGYIVFIQVLSFFTIILIILQIESIAAEILEVCSINVMTHVVLPFFVLQNSKVW